MAKLHFPDKVRQNVSNILIKSSEAATPASSRASNMKAGKGVHASELLE